MDDPEDKKTRGDKKTMLERAKPVGGTSGKPPVYDIIGRRMRDYFNEVANQPVPDRFLELLNQLESKTSAKKDN